jgi:glycosyltransferase involved in cell wall biosynthesis
MADKKGKPVIWTICFWYPPVFSGAGMQAHREHLRWIRQGMAITVLTAGVSAAYCLRGKTLNNDGFAVSYLPVIPFPDSSRRLKSGWLTKVLFSILCNISLFSFAVECGWILLFTGRRNDIVKFEATDKYSILPIAIARMRGLHPIIRMSLMGSDDPYSILKVARRGQFFQYLSLAAFHLAEKLIAISSGMIESCQKANLSCKQVVYIPHGIDTDVYQPVGSDVDKAKIRLELGLDITKRYIIFVGSAIERKGIDVLVEAFVRLRQKLDDVELLIVGPDQFDQGAYYDVYNLQKTLDRCKEKLIAARCSNFVHWTGKVENVHEYMQAADLFCFPTRQEGSPLAIIEAMACGLPILVAYLEGVTTDLIPSEQVGATIHGYDCNDYTGAMIDLFSQPEKAKQMGLAARERAVLLYSLKSSFQQWDRLFQDLTKGN